MNSIQRMQDTKGMGRLSVSVIVSISPSMWRGVLSLPLNVLAEVEFISHLM